MAKFPTVSALAGAPLDDMLAAWAGLGYYSRARNLHASARAVDARFGGVLPARAAELRAVPGIGPYTAGAIASIAFGERAPLVDGKVARVLARVFAMEHDIKSTAGGKALWSAAAELMRAARGRRARRPEPGADGARRDDLPRDPLSITIEDWAADPWVAVAADLAGDGSHPRCGRACCARPTSTVSYGCCGGDRGAQPRLDRRCDGRGRAGRRGGSAHGRRPALIHATLALTKRDEILSTFTRPGNHRAIAPIATRRSHRRRSRRHGW
jgi:hypothetical protein